MNDLLHDGYFHFEFSTSKLFTKLQGNKIITFHLDGKKGNNEVTDKPGYNLAILRHHRVQAASLSSWALFWPIRWPE